MPTTILELTSQSFLRVPDMQTGLIALLGLTGVAAFLVFFVIATTNTIVVALLGSMAAVGACVAVFFAALTAIYIGALSIAVFVISSIAFMTMFAVVTAASAFHLNLIQPTSFILCGTVLSYT